MDVIVVENLVKRYKELLAVNHISFSVEKYSIFGFLGPNGAGKTTTINILCTLTRPTSGKVYVNGYDCLLNPSDVRRSIGVVFQDTTLDNDLTAFENLLFHAYLYKIKRDIAKDRIKNMLKFVGLYDRKDEQVKRFSGGMRRKLEVVRGLIHNPAVLFLDEPTLGLDPHSRANLWDFIKNLPNREGTTIFMTTHYMDEAEVCDKIAIIDKGRIIAQGTPNELKNMIGGDVVFFRTKDDVNHTKEKLKRMLNMEVLETNGELSITIDHSEEIIPLLLKLIGDDLIYIRLQKPTLNDVFLRLTTKGRTEEISKEDIIKEEVRAIKRKFYGN
ncbi:MAG: ATP-binding cassette domain-containing protein [Nitrospirae bacterium]|nr:MAG: ATP-binding cassette domain-containing protein [Nitrospirota bacterium]